MNHSAYHLKKKRGFVPVKCRAILFLTGSFYLTLLSCTNNNKDIDHSMSIPFLKSNGKYVYVNTAGENVISKEYLEASLFKNGIAVVKDESGEFYINTSGELLFGQKFQKA